MPEYGLCDKSPEELGEEKFFQEQHAIFKAAEDAELEARRRQVAAEESIIRTAEMLDQMKGQMQEIRDTQAAEQQARISAEVKAAKDTEKQRRADKARFIFTAIIGILTLIAGIVAAVAAIFPLIPK